MMRTHRLKISGGSSRELKLHFIIAKPYQSGQVAWAVRVARRSMFAMSNISPFIALESRGWNREVLIV
jgi:hypothetical protein